jgi:hypothetical protein
LGLKQRRLRPSLRKRIFHPTLLGLLRRLPTAARRTRQHITKVRHVASLSCAGRQPTKHSLEAGAGNGLEEARA